MSFIEINSVPGEKSSHGSGDTDASALQQEMRVVAHQRPGIEGTPPGGHVFAELVDKAPPIRIIGKEIVSVDPPNNDVMQGAGGIQAGMSRHDSSLCRLDRECHYKSHRETTSPKRSLAVLRRHVPSTVTFAECAKLRRRRATPKTDGPVLPSGSER